MVNENALLLVYMLALVDKRRGSLVSNKLGFEAMLKIKNSSKSYSQSNNKA